MVSIRYRDSTTDSTHRRVRPIYRTSHSIDGVFGSALSVSPLQMSLPADGKGAHIKVSISHSHKRKLPNQIEFILDGARLEVPLEIDKDYQDYQLLKS
jgi:hypothetical protein